MEGGVTAAFCRAESILIAFAGGFCFTARESAKKQLTVKKHYDIMVFIIKPIGRYVYEHKYKRKNRSVPFKDR